MKIAAIIPARYESTRLPGKVLAEIAGRPMVQHVYERACECEHLDEVIVATDDSRVQDAVCDFGGRCVMTRKDHACGTDRIAEVAARADYDIIVNVQGDEPLIRPEVIAAAVGPFLEDDTLRMGTVATPILDEAEHLDPSAVKVVVDRSGFALYFSRAPVPYFRTDDDAGFQQRPKAAQPLKHIGLYVYTAETVLWLSSQPQTPLEQSEKLEQLRALENGCPIRVVEVDYSPVGVDTPADLQHVREFLEESE
ncbi:MAG: 3-deoxy-manno-octulosonate cytidylyltransferase [Armatimonadota bacterium]